MTSWMLMRLIMRVVKGSLISPSPSSIWQHEVQESNSAFRQMERQLSMTIMIRLHWINCEYVSGI